MSVDYLRISVTDRCNLRCIYCNPLGGCGFIERREILSFEEIHRIADFLLVAASQRFDLPAVSR